MFSSVCPVVLSASFVRNYCCYVFFLIGAGCAALPPACYASDNPWIVLPYEAATQKADTVVLGSGPRRISVRACSANSLRISVQSPEGTRQATPVFPETVCKPYTQVRIEKTAEYVRVDTGEVIVSINLATAKTIVETSAKQILLEIPDAANSQQLEFQHSDGQRMYGGRGFPVADITSTGSFSIFSGDHGFTAAPFIWTTAGYGILWDADPSSVSIANTSFTILQPGAEELTYYVVVGTPSAIFAGVADLSGHAPLFPKFALGFMNSEWGITETELRNDVQTYRQKQIPLDMYILDYDWFGQGEDDWGDFKWQPDLFPNGANGTLLKELLGQGVHIATIRKPWLRPGTVQWREAKSKGFMYSDCEVQRNAKACNQKNTISKEFNFQSPAARAWWWEHSKPLLQTGIAGYWNDEAEMNRNFRTLEMQQTYYEGQRASSDRRVWSLNRNFHLGSQRYAFASWSGDFDSSFENMAAQRGYILGTIALGQAWVGMDLGGFKSREWWLDFPEFVGKPTPENYARWIQLGAFIPVFRVHGRRNQEREPWHYGERAEQAAKDAIALRYRMLPYLYSCARKTTTDGLPFIRPLFFDYPDDPRVQGLTSEWLFGDSMLVRPIVEQGIEKVEIYLPQGNWIDYFTKRRFAGSQSITYPVDAVNWSTIPLFIKEGAIFPVAPPIQYSDEIVQDPILVEVYPAKDRSSFLYYEDDGISYAYESGDYWAIPFETQSFADHAIFELGAVQGSLKQPARKYMIRLHPPGNQRIAAVSRNDLILPQVAATKDAKVQGWYVANDGGTNVVIVTTELDTYDSLKLIYQ